jgi:primosomal protein N' (replication factor Y) (superfamily II helicase)
MTINRFADIILPIAVRGRFTYRIPDSLLDKIKPGVRVTVPFGSKNLYFGIVIAIHDRQPDVKKLRSIIAVPDLVPAVNETQLKLWLWISEYYLCSEGEVMKAALPSETSLEGYRPRMETFIGLSREYTDKELNEILDKLAKAPRQQELLLFYINLTGYTEGLSVKLVSKQLLLSEAKSSHAIIETLIRKGILKTISSEVTRLARSISFREPVRQLSDSQLAAFDSIKAQFREKEIVLLHGVTSSGKTEIYIRLIEEQLNMGKQVLYMLPEIALTTQIILRLKKALWRCNRGISFPLQRCRKGGNMEKGCGR